MEDLRREVFRIALLDAQNGLLRDRVISEGTLSASLVHPREVFKPAILESAASVILLHNHPSGDPTPSREDVRLTRQLVEVRAAARPAHPRPRRSWATADSSASRRRGLI